MAPSTTIPMSSGIAMALKSIYESGKYSDMTIKCGGQVFRVHRCIVCPRSAVLAKMIDGNFKEALTGEIELPSDEPLIAQKMLDFIYTSDYSVNVPGKKDYASISPQKMNPSSPTANKLSEVHDPPLVVHAKLYIIGDIYDIQDLKDLATEKYAAAITKAWNTPAFTQSLRELYENTMEKDRQMKDVAMPIIKNRVKLLLCNANFATLLKQNGELAFEVLCESVGHKDRIDASIESEGFEYYCHYCGEHYYRDDDMNSETGFIS